MRIDAVVDDGCELAYRSAMTKVEFNLPDALAKEAREIGLLEQERLEQRVRAELRREAGQRLLATMKQLHAVSGPEMPMDEITALVKEVRRERRESEAANR